MSRLENGWVILMFPEGTRTPDGKLGPVKKGPAFIADRTGAPIVPAVLRGAYEMWPRTRKLPSMLGWPFHRLEVHFGEPVRPEDFKEFSGREKVAEITACLEKRMHEIFDSCDG